MATTVKDSTLGRRIRAAEFQDFSISETCYAPGARLASHEHDFTYLSLVLRGTFEESVGRNTELAKSASLVVMPRGVAHGECIGPLGARSVTVTLKAPFLEEGPRSRCPLEKWRWFHGGPVARIMLRAYQECLLEDVGLELGLCELLAELPTAIAGERDWNVGSSRRCVAAALERLHCQGTGGMRLADLAAELATDPAYLARAFRQRMGCTMSEYRRRLRVQEAAHLLASTDTPLGHVALSAGFADQSHLCRVFKAETGLTPQAYRLLAGRG
jgi:AraC family transcriptional regulator